MNIFLPDFWADNAYMKTTDMRVHVGVHWGLGEEQTDLAWHLGQAPNNVTFLLNAEGGWQIDRISNDVFGG